MKAPAWPNVVVKLKSVFGRIKEREGELPAHGGHATDKPHSASVNVGDVER